MALTHSITYIILGLKERKNTGVSFCWLSVSPKSTTEQVQVFSPLLSCYLHFNTILWPRRSLPFHRPPISDLQMLPSIFLGRPPVDVIKLSGKTSPHSFPLPEEVLGDFFDPPRMEPQMSGMFYSVLSCFSLAWENAC